MATTEGRVTAIFTDDRAMQVSAVELKQGDIRGSTGNWTLGVQKLWRSESRRR